MGQFAVILTISALLLGGVLLFNARTSTQQAAADTGDYTVDRIAREAALVGLRQTERKLANRPNSWPNYWTSGVANDSFGVATATYTTDDFSANYQVTIDDVVPGATPDDPDRVWITATGFYDGWNSATNSTGTTDFVIKAVYEQGFTDVGLPPEYRQAVITDEDFGIRGNACINGGVHANGELTNRGGSFDIFGQGTCSTATCDDSFDGDRATGGTAEIDSIYIPPVVVPPADPDTVLTGDVIFDATACPPAVPGGTETAGNTCTDDVTGAVISHDIADGWFGVTGKGDDEPYVVYITGDGNNNANSPSLTINGNVRAVGNMRIYVDGPVEFGGNNTFAPVPDTVASTADDIPRSTSSNSSCADHFAAIETWVNTYLPNGQSTATIYATGDIEIGGTVAVVAHLYTNGAINYTGGGNKLVIGGLTAKQPLDTWGNARVYYTETSILTLPGGSNDVPAGVRLVAYREWAQRPS